MSYGLEVRDGAGNLVVGPSDRLTKLLGVVSISASGSLSLPGALQGNSYWFTFIPTTSGFTGTPPVISISGATLTWTYPAGASNLNGNIHYGMY